MEIDLEDPVTDAHPEDQLDRLGLIALTIDVIRRPVTAMRRLAAHPDRRWLPPLVALVVLSLAATVASFPAMGDLAYAPALEQMQESPQFGESRDDAATTQAEAMTSEEIAGFARTAGRVTSSIGAVLGPIIALLACAAILHFLGTILGGQQTFTQMLTVISWARIPLGLQSLARLVYRLTGGHYDPYPNGLEGLVAPGILDQEAVASYWQPVLAQISLWNVWMLALAVVAVHAVSRISRRKALVAVGVYVALLVLLGFGTVGFGRLMTDLASGF